MQDVATLRKRRGHDLESDGGFEDSQQGRPLTDIGLNTCDVTECTKKHPKLNSHASSSWGSYLFIGLKSRKVRLLAVTVLLFSFILLSPNIYINDHLGIAALFIPKYFSSSTSTAKKFSALKNAPPTFRNSTYFESAIGRDIHTNMNAITGTGKATVRYMCSLKPGSKTNVETALSRIILFQSNGAHQLKNFMAHYSKVVPLNHIVIIDHQNMKNNNDDKFGTDQESSADDYTQKLLLQYNELGSDIWRCEGSFNLKSEMWSWVTLRYTESSEFVFPLDIDEFITTLKNIEGGNDKEEDGKHQQQEMEQILTWNKDDWTHALKKIQKLREESRKYGSKPFKMEQGNVYPVDCDDEIFHRNADGAQQQNLDRAHRVGEKDSLLHYDVGPMEKVKYVARRHTKRVHCMDKNFFFGKDFNFTDTGNHYGQTHSISMKKLRQKCLDSNETTYAPYAEQVNDLYLIHMQFTTFEEWLMHALRGAADRGFNHFTRLKKCREGMTSREYCQSWEALTATKFDPREMRKLYQHEVCGRVREGSIPFSIMNLIG